MQKFEVKSKIWVESEAGRVFGDGPSMLLESIDKLGSLRQAAQKMEMSYAQAMEIIKMIEQNLGYSVINRRIGGSSGGGSQLTEEGKVLLQKYVGFREELSEEIERLYQKYFNDK